MALTLPPLRQDLRAMQGWHSGYVAIAAPTILRDAVTGLVCGLVEGALVM
jgi:hypothetical protein